MGSDQAADQSAGVGLQRRFVALMRTSSAGDVRGHALGLRADARPVQREQHHRLDQAIDVEALGGGSSGFVNFSR